MVCNLGIYYQTSRGFLAKNGPMKGNEELLFHLLGAARLLIASHWKKEISPAVKERLKKWGVIMEKVTHTLHIPTPLPQIEVHLSNFFELEHLLDTPDLLNVCDQRFQWT